MGQETNEVWYQDALGTRHTAYFLGQTPAGAHLLVTIDGVPRVLRGVPEYDGAADRPSWRRPSVAPLHCVPVLRKTAELEIVYDSGWNYEMVGRAGG
jgi:hypothetical protein